MKKRILSLWLVFVLCLSLMPMSAFAADSINVTAAWDPQTQSAVASWTPVAGAAKYEACLNAGHKLDSGAISYMPVGDIITCGSGVTTCNFPKDPYFSYQLGPNAVDSWRVSITAFDSSGEKIWVNATSAFFSGTFSINMNQLSTPVATLSKDGTASWNNVQNANEYIVKLWREEAVLKEVKTDETSYDFSEEMKYYSNTSKPSFFHVTVVARNGNGGFFQSEQGISNEEKYAIISHANCEIAWPEAGEHPDFTPTSSDSYRFAVSIVDWYKVEGGVYEKIGADDTFEAGKTYAPCISFKANSGHTFDENTEFTINSRDAVAFGGSTIRITDYTVPIKCTVTAQYNSQTQSAVASWTPVAGAAKYEARLNVGHKLDSGAISYMQVGDIITCGSGVTTCNFPKDPYFSYQLGPDVVDSWRVSITAFDSSGEKIWLNATSVFFSDTFSTAVAPITNANCIITVPEAGANPDQSPVSADSGKYTVSVVQWYLYESPYPELKTTDIFEAGKKYALRVRFTAESGYTFDENTKFTINGLETRPCGVTGLREVVFAVPADPSVITSADCTIDTPSVGNYPDSSPVSADSGKYTVSVEQWYLNESPYPELKTTDTFEAGKKYALRVRFTAESGYTFDENTKFTINGLETQPCGATGLREVVFAVPADVPTTYTITVTGEGNPAAYYLGAPISEQKAGLPVVLKADSTYNGRDFDKWVSNDVVISDSEKADGAYFTMPSKAVTVTATYKNATEPTITSVEVTPATATVAKGDSKQFSAVVNGTGAFDDAVTWSITGGDLGTNISSDGLLSIADYNTEDTITVKATSVADPSKYGTATVTLTDATKYAVTVLNDGNGTASANPTSAAKGETVTLTATPATGYHFKEWQSSDVTISGNTFTMPEKNVTVKAIFEQDTPTPVKITKVAVTGVPTPVVGASTAISASDVTITTDPADSTNVYDIFWYNYTDSTDTDTTFKANCEYFLNVELTNKDGYYFEFDNSEQEYYLGQATVNGEEPEIAWSFGYDDLVIMSKHVFPADIGEPPLPTPITKVEVQVTEPVAGESPDTAAVVVTTPEGAATVFEVPEWYDDDDNAVTVFEEGKDYYCWLSLAPKDGYVFEFEAGTGITDYCGTALVNGEEAIVAESRNGYPTYLYVDQKFTAKAAAPVKITEIVITDADITPVLGEKAGDHLAYTLPADCHYSATMNGWWDILGSRIMAADDVFEDGGLYCASWNFVADEGYAFAANATITINGSTENVDTEHSYLDTTGDEPLFIISAKGVLVEAQPPAPAYTIIAGMDGEWTKGSMAGLSFTSDAPFAKFDSVQVDGSTIAAANYTAEEGSTKITLAPAYLETLSIGSHSIVVVSTDGTASTNFTVKAAAQPPVPAAYTVTFDMGGHGTAPADQTVDEGGKAERPADPAESGWTFGGWYADAAFSAVFDFDTAINADTIIYAKWTENPAPQPDDPAVPPKTGDSSRMLLWGMLLAAGGAALTGTAAYSRKKKKAD